MPVSSAKTDAITYPYAGTRATRVLSEAINAKSPGVSLRTMAGRLGYKSAVVLSHMRTGRLPIPVDRAVEIAKAVGADPEPFLALVLEQRYPDVDFRKALGSNRTQGTDTSVSPSTARILAEFEKFAGMPFDQMPAEHLGVLREVVADRHPRRRWIGISEVSVIELVRAIRPDFARDGMDAEPAAAFAKALKLLA